MNWPLLQNSLLVAGATTLLATSAGLVAALGIISSSRRLKNLLLLVAVLTLALPPFLVVNCWLHYLGSNGVWRPVIRFNILSLGGTVWVLTLLTWPIAVLFVTGAWNRLQPADLESDPLLSGPRLIRHVLLPAARRPLLQAALLIFALALSNFAVPAILQTKVLPAEAWIRFNTAFDTPGALRLSLPLMLAALVVLLCIGRREAPWPQFQSTAQSMLFRRRLGICALVGWVFIGALECVSFGLPVFQIASTKRTWTELLPAIAAGRHQLWNSFILAAGSATVLIALSLIFGTRAANRGWHAPASARLLSSLLWLPFFVPGVLIGIGLIALFNHSLTGWFYQSAGIVVLAYTLRYLGLGWYATSHALRTLDPELTDAARLDGAGMTTLLWRVHRPRLAPQLAAAWYIIFLLCLWDVESMILVYPPGRETMALRVFNLLHFGDNAQVNALCLALLVIAAVPFAAWKLLDRRYGGLAVSLALLLLAPGCGRNLATGETPLDSRFFTSVRVIGTRGVGVGQLNKPRSLAVDGVDDLFVVDMTGRVQKFSSAGIFLLSWQMPQTDLGKPKGMCRDHDGNIIVVEPHYQRINHFTQQGTLLAQWGVSGTNLGQFKLPRAVAANSRGEIFVSEYGAAERVQRFRVKTPATGSAAAQVECLGSIGHAGTGPGEFNRPEGLCIDAQDRLYVADSCNHRIQVFASDGQFLASYGHAGSGKGELSYPYDICVDSAGRQYVCEFGNSRIQVFDAQHQPLEIIGGAGAEPGQFNNPWGVALDSEGNLYVADSMNHRVQKLIRAERGLSHAADRAGAGESKPPSRVLVGVAGPSAR